MFFFFPFHNFRNTSVCMIRLTPTTVLSNKDSDVNPHFTRRNKFRGLSDSLKVPEQINASIRCRAPGFRQSNLFWSQAPRRALHVLSLIIPPHLQERGQGCCKHPAWLSTSSSSASHTSRRPLLHTFSSQHCSCCVWRGLVLEAGSASALTQKHMAAETVRPSKSHTRHNHRESRLGAPLQLCVSLHHQSSSPP